MPHYTWLLVTVLLLIPSVVVLWLKVVMRKDDSAISGTGGSLFSLLCFVAAIWVIHDKLS